MPFLFFEDAGISFLHDFLLSYAKKKEKDLAFRQNIQNILETFTLSLGCRLGPAHWTNASFMMIGPRKESE